jgi:polar amino acid transport system permease protein
MTITNIRRLMTAVTIAWALSTSLVAHADATLDKIVELVKASAVAYAIAVGDITYQSIMIWTQRDNVLALMLLILSFFGVVTWMVTLAGRWLEQRFKVPGYGY